MKDESSLIRYAKDPAIDLVIQRLIAEAQRVMRREFTAKEYPSLDFDDTRWCLNRIDVAKRVNSVLFYRIDGEGARKRDYYQRSDVLPSAYADVIKAWLILSNMSPRYMITCSISLRYLWTSLSRTFGDSFLWDRLAATHLITAAKYVESEFPKSARHHEMTWSLLLKWLHQNQIVHDSLEWRVSAPDTNNRLSAATRERRLDRLPRQEVLVALGQIYKSYAKEPIDRLLICALGLLFVGGFRSGELTAMPEDCWVEEKVKGRTRYGLRYWNEKNKEGQFKSAIRWLSPLGAELARECIDEIRNITRRAREQARILENDPKRVQIPGIGRKKWLTREEVGKALGVKPYSVPHLIRNGYMKLKPRELAYRRRVYDRKEVEAELLRRRPPLNTIRLSPTRFQKLSETLLISFVYETDPQASTSPLLVRNVPESAIQIFIGAQDKSPSAFERFGFNNMFVQRGEDPLRLRLHSVRHWLNTVANNAGMTVFQITVWMQRTSIAQSLLYLHDGPDIADYTRQLLREGKVAGTLAERYASLSSLDDREQFLKTIEDAHVAATSLCGRSFRSQRCAKSKACEDKCEYSLAIIKDARPIKALLEKRDQLKLAREHFKKLRQKGIKIVGRQRTMCDAMLREIEYRLRVAKGKGCPE